ncbi:SusC/RagA family TonB-linked outer membrane protein [Psychroflexus salinarum]|uniref:SusC/RagA family TonB-linked outer membrane protein n=1 Tax=Psychroflexus salinarum TaxID=546024 RepID=A0ABW3GRM7_9FLAO
MKLKINGILTLILVLVVQVTFAQTKTVTGTVTDPDGYPLPGVNVLIDGKGTGTQTDFDGIYSIDASSSDRLVFSYIGFTKQTIQVGAKTEINVQLERGEALDEVVVVGYGTTTKQAFAGSAKQIDAENIASKNFSNVSQSLAGEAAGVTVINTSGQPGTTSQVRIRGFGSVNGNRAPLYVVDGVPFSGSLNSINPNDIKSTTILKDATATAIYGSRGANGVVLITTKSGTAEGNFVEADVKTGVNFQLIDRYDVIESPEQYIGLVWEGLYNRNRVNGLDNAAAIDNANNNLFSPNNVPVGYNMWNAADGGELINPTTRTVNEGITRRYTPKRYAEEAFNVALRKEANIRMGGGDDTSRYFFSTGYLDDQGYAINTGYERITTRLNLQSQVKDWLDIQGNIGYAYSESIQNGQTDGAENLFEFADKMAPIFPVFLRDDNYQLVPDPIFGGNQYDYGSDSGFRDRPNANTLNPIASARYDRAGYENHEINGSFSVNINLSDNLTFETNLGAQYFNRIDKDARNPFYGGGRANQGDLFLQNRQDLIINALQLLRYNNSFGDHNLEVLAAHETNKRETNISNAYKGKVVVPGLYELSNYVQNLQQPFGYTFGRSLESYFSQVNYNYKDTYYLTASIRTDGSSRFTTDKWDTFGSVGGAWILSNEDFLVNNKYLNFLKLKASWGVTGDESGVGFYTGQDLWNQGLLGEDYTFSLREVGNPDLTWEISKMAQVGTEFRLGKYLDVTLDYYRKDTENLIFDRRIPLSTGESIITVNDGELRNQGLEFDISSTLVETADFNLSATLNGASYKNELTRMPIDPSTNEAQVLNRNGIYGYSDGSSIYDFYMREWAGVDSSNGAPLWNQYFNDENGNGILDGSEEAIQSLTPYLDENPEANVAKRVTDDYATATDKYVGKSAIPDVAGAFRLNATYKNFNISTQFTYQIGGYGYDNQYSELMTDRFGAAGNNFHSDILGRWQQPGDITNVPRLADAADVNAASTSTRFLTKSDYFALNNLLVGYTFNQKMLGDTGIKSLNIFVSGDNLFANTVRDGYNPQTRQDGFSGRALYAPLTTLTMGVNVKF